VSAVEAQADLLLDQRRYDEALALVSDFRERVTDDPRLIYEEGLIYRHRGQLDWSLSRLEESVAADPSLGFAWYDLGEVRLLVGQRPAAKEAFARALPGTDAHPSGWVVPLKLAEMAAQDTQPEAWDRWLREALRRGFRLSMVVENPAWTQQWQGYLATSELAGVLRRLATVYGEEQALEQLLQDR